MLGDPRCYVIVDVLDTPYYVQWHAEEDGEFYVEASSLVYDGRELPAEVAATLENRG